MLLDPVHQAPILQAPIFQPDGPWLHPVVATEAELCDQVAELSKAANLRVVCRRIRGNKARTVQGWFDECSAALQFPCYFGENWNAFDECITDLEWLPADAYVLVVSNGCRLLEAEPPRELTLLFATLERAGQEWSKAVAGQFPRPPKPFHVLIECNQPEERSLCAKLDAAKVGWSPYRATGHFKRGGDR
jgi:hypothetical protein